MFVADMSLESWLLFLFSAGLMGMSKAGIHGIGMLAIALLVLPFGGKVSAGLILPTLILADIFAVSYYKHFANWSLLVKLFPFVAVGILLGTWLGVRIDDALFTKIMGVIIFISLGLMVGLENKKNIKLLDYKWFPPLVGLAGGFATMVGNLAGPVMALYLLSARLPKNSFIGTAAWFFLIINFFKLPLHILFWQTITLNTILLNLTALPLIGAGAWAGIIIVKKFPELHYRWFIIATTALTAVVILF